MNQYEIIKRPLITEKTNIQKELHNQLSFEVDRRANRIKLNAPLKPYSMSGLLLCELPR